MDRLGENLKIIAPATLQQPNHKTESSRIRLLIRRASDSIARVKMERTCYIFQREAERIIKSGAGDGFPEDFRSLFGVGLDVCVTAWNLCVASHRLPFKCRHHHFLWALTFLRIYGTEKLLCRIVGTTRKTYRKWVWPIIRCLASLKPQLVR